MDNIVWVRVTCFCIVLTVHLIVAHLASVFIVNTLLPSKYRQSLVWHTV